jgi:hypothetical protein
VLEGWIVEPSREVKAAAAGVQESLRRFDWVELVPEHFLHVWLGVPERLGEAPLRWPELAPFEIGYPRPNCFHNAVVIEVMQPMPRLVAGTQNDLPEFLPHMTVAVTLGGRRDSAPRPAPVVTRRPRSPKRACRATRSRVRPEAQLGVHANRA